MIKSQPQSASTGLNWPHSQTYWPHPQTYWPHPQLASPPAPLQGERGVICLVDCPLVTPRLKLSLTGQLVNSLTGSLVNYRSYLLINSPPSLPLLKLLSTRQLVNLSTGLLVNLSTGSLVNLSFLVHFLAKVLTLWLRFFPPIVHQGAKNRFSRGVVLVQTGECLRMRKNEYLLPRIVFYTIF